MNLPDGLNGIQIEMRRRRASVIYGRFDVSGRCQVGGIINRGDAVYCHPPGSPYSEPGSLINISRESSRSLPSPNASLMDDSAHAGRSLIIIMIPSSSKSLGGGGGAAGFFEDVFWGSLRVAPPRGIQPQDEFFFFSDSHMRWGILGGFPPIAKLKFNWKKKREPWQDRYEHLEDPIMIIMLRSYRDSFLADGFLNKNSRRFQGLTSGSRWRWQWNWILSGSFSDLGNCFKDCCKNAFRIS